LESYTLIYIYILLFLVFRGVFLVAYKYLINRETNEVIIKKELKSTFKFFINNCVIVMVYHIIIYKTVIVIAHIHSYFLGVIFVQLFIIFIFNDIVNFLKNKKSSFLVKLLLILKSDKNKNDIEEIVKYLNGEDGNEN